ncbi:MAG TPA: hypothetical protein VEI50_12635 [Nitrospiraceae bacterium]|nr:hypothetical protein [Nitrospiraceae bacterium]
MSERWLLEKEHTILERPFMEFRPFGSTERGEKIRDLSGMAIWPMVEHLERSVAQRRGGAAGTQAIRELCRRLNERIKDPVYHVTPAFLGRRWNSYSCEFAAYLYEFCEQLSGDPRFAFVAGHEKASPIMQTLARPFPLATIYTMFPYFANKYAPGSLECDVKSISGTSARLTMRFTEHAYRQFGPYRKRCAYLRCQAAQGLLSAVPERVHRLPAAQIHEHACIAEGDQWCEWDIVWSSKTRYARVRRLFCDLSPHERLNPNQIAGRKTAVPDVTARTSQGFERRQSCVRKVRNMLSQPCHRGKGKFQETAQIMNGLPRISRLTSMPAATRGLTASNDPADSWYGFSPACSEDLQHSPISICTVRFSAWLKKWG